ncbi:MAG: DUF4143 domain-containing protein [Candidatus Aminicenantes bacterium]|nr:DUF4143 domain-containing protein [Candidatus Aminicenantes bacterium]
MELSYAVFLLSPHSDKIARAVKKERKAYFFDWGRCRTEAKRFENYIAVELKAMTDLWHDQGLADFDLRYVRTRDGKETDFLITRDGAPWCLFEAKLQDGAVERHHLGQAGALGNVPYVQLARESGICKIPFPGVYRISAGRFF